MKITLAAILFIGLLYTFTEPADAWFPGRFAFGRGWFGGFRPWWGYGGWGLGGWGYGGWGYAGYPWYFRRAVEPRPRVECNFFDSRSLLSCVTPNSTVECESFGLFEKHGTAGFFNFYAVSAVPRGDLSKPETVRFSLYPEMLEERGWLNTSFVDSATNKSYVYSLYSGEESDRGFRVKDSVCFGRLVGLFTGLGFNETIVVGRGPEHFEQVDVLGGVLIA